MRKPVYGHFTHILQKENAISNHSVSGLCCVCHLFLLLCPYLVCFLSLFMSLWVNLCPAVCMWLCVNYPVYLVPVFWVWFRLVYSLLPGVSVLSCLDVLIKYYYLSLYPRMHVPVPPSLCAPWQKTRPNRKRCPSPSFCFCFLKVFILFLSVCPAAWKSPLIIPTLAHCKSAWEFGGIATSAASPLAASPHARRSREISA